MTALYVDLSHHDWDRVKGEFDWPRIRSAASSVLCLRATYGDPQGYNPTTRHFADMARGARSAGFDTIGGYHNLIKGDQASINRQVDYLRRTLDGVGANWAMLDVERYPELVNNGLWPRFDDVVQFCDRWRAVDKRVLTVYLPRWIWSGHLGSPDLRVLRAPIVASNYGSNPNGTPSGVYAARGGDSGPGWASYGNVTPTIWQYGSNVDCPGASGQTDCNAYRGTLVQLRALLTPGGGDDMALFTEAHATAVEVTDARLEAVVNGRPAVAFSDAKGQPVWTTLQINALTAAVTKLGAVVAAESANPAEVRAALAELPRPLTAQEITDAVRAAVTGGPITDEQFERVLRKVIGSVDNTLQA